jgi:hypothetical protein
MRSFESSREAAFVEIRQAASLDEQPQPHYDEPLVRKSCKNVICPLSVEVGPPSWMAPTYQASESWERTRLACWLWHTV